MSLDAALSPAVLHGAVYVAGDDFNSFRDFCKEYVQAVGDILEVHERVEVRIEHCDDLNGDVTTCTSFAFSSLIMLVGEVSECECHRIQFVHDFCAKRVHQVSP